MVRATSKWLVLFAFAFAIWTLFSLKPRNYTTKTHKKEQLSFPESVTEMDLCIEKCKYFNKSLCTKNLYMTNFYPAPTCKSWSTNLEEDIYYTNKAESKALDSRTFALHSAYASLVNPECSHHRPKDQRPMVKADEYHFFVKTVINHQPTSYVEWGTGKSSQHYPLLINGKSFLMDNYQPWCDKVVLFPAVKCMKDAGRLQYLCQPPFMRADGTPLLLEKMGNPQKGTTEEDIRNMARYYVSAIDQSDIEHGTLDLALVDGRFRTVCAIKLLPYLAADGILVMHDFAMRRNIYGLVHDYYDFVGRSRSYFAFKRKPESELPANWHVAFEEHISTMRVRDLSV